jgi:hypothetical protein
MTPSSTRKFRLSHFNIHIQNYYYSHCLRWVQNSVFEYKAPWISNFISVDIQCNIETISLESFVGCAHLSPRTITMVDACWTCNTHGKTNKCVQTFGWKFWMKETTPDNTDLIKKQTRQVCELDWVLPELGPVRGLGDDDTPPSGFVRANSCNDEVYRLYKREPALRSYWFTSVYFTTGFKELSAVVRICVLGICQDLVPLHFTVWSFGLFPFAAGFMERLC